MTPEGALAGRTALVAGATGTIGSRVCGVLAGDGARVVVHSGSSVERAEALAASLPGAGHRVVQARLETPEGIAELGAAVQDAGVGILVNAVHLGSGTSPVAEIDPDAMRVHLESAVLHAQLCGLVAPGMRADAWGRIVYISGALMTRPAPGMAGLGAAKAAASTLTRYLALEEGRAGITANIVAPGRVVDPDAAEELDEEWARLAATLAGRTALGRFPTPDDVASAVRDLVRPSASGITGQTVWVTGGEPIV